MRTSLIETEQIEGYLMGDSQPGDNLVFEARLILEPELKDKLYWQQKTYSIVKAYGRDQLRKEIEMVHQKLFTLPVHHTFGQKIRQIFSKR